MLSNQSDWIRIDFGPVLYNPAGRLARRPIVLINKLTVQQHFLVVDLSACTYRYIYLCQAIENANQQANGKSN
jgi:hypothetical protein